MKQRLDSRTGLLILAFLGAYYVTGRLSLVLAVPPGIASPVWPPAGIALAAVLMGGYRMWPVAFLGSAALYWHVSPSGEAWRLAAAITTGAGAALQAVFSAFLVRRYVGKPLELIREQDVAKFFILASPIGCLVSATAGVLTLLAVGSVPPEQALYSWWAWWMGDSIGVGVVTPVLLVFWGEPREVWARRKISVAVPLACVLTLTVTLFVWIGSIERAKTKADFEKYAERVTLSVKSNVDNAIALVRSVGNFYAATPDAENPAIFSAFAKTTLEINPSIYMLSWNPRVTEAELAAFLQHTRAVIDRDFRITERDAAGRFIPSASRPEHVVILHRAPAPAIDTFRGYDVASDPLRRAILQQACRTGRTLATSRIPLRRNGGTSYGVLVHVPVYAAGPIPEEPDLRCESVRGYVTGVFQIRDVMNAALSAYADPDVKVTVNDEAATGDERVLWPPEHEGVSGGAAALESSGVETSPDASTQLAHIEVGGRSWSILYSATKSYGLGAMTWRPWIAVAGGMLFTGLLASFLLVVTGKAVIIERLGAERAAELSAANASLQHEIAEKQQAEQLLRENETKLRHAQKMEAIGRLAGGIAHDFNNLLTAILGYGAVVRSSLTSASPLLDDVEEIMKAGERASKLTQQLLAFSRKQVLQPKTLDLNRAVSEVHAMLRRLMREDIELVTDLDPDLGRVLADPSQVEQVLMNLAVNAADAMPSGGTLTLRTQNFLMGSRTPDVPEELQSGSHVVLEVYDTGVGMDERTLAHLFEPFFTTKEPGKGTGLGLSTVYGIIQQSQGAIAVKSDLGKGTTFTLYFPRIQDLVAESKAPVIAEEPQGGRETVLLVEDEEGVRRLSRKVLGNKGYNVLEAKDGEEGLSVAAEYGGAIDILVTDLVMPRLGGRELADQLLERQPGLKVLYLSGYSEVAIQTRGMLSVNSAFIAKPFTPASLLRTVRSLLDAA